MKTMNLKKENGKENDYIDILVTWPGSRKTEKKNNSFY